MAWTRSLRRNQQVEAKQPRFLKAGVFHTRRLESRSIHHKYTSNRREPSSSNIIHPHAKCVGYIWPLLADQELDKTRKAETELIRGHLLFFFSLWLCADWCVLSSVQYACGHHVCSVRYSLVIREARSQCLIYLWTCTHFAACLCTIWTWLSADGYAASQISFTWESIQMCTVIISAISHVFTLQLSHRGLSGTVGSQL